MSKFEGGRKMGGDSGNVRLLNEIETISKGLYADKRPSRSTSSSSIGSNVPKLLGKNQLPDPKSKAKPGGDNSLLKEKRSFWNWKPLKAFTHIRNRRFNCCFTLEVHSVEGLPSDLHNISLCVHWKRRDGIFVTNPVKLVQGAAKFEEKLTHTCSVYGSRSGPHHSAKYEAKHFLLYASVFGAPELDLGKHRVDLTRLLPLTLEELEEEKSSGNWTTSFKLSGKAKGATLNVSFGYTVLGDNTSASRSSQNAPEGVVSRPTNSSLAKVGTKYSQVDARRSMQRGESLPSQRSRASTRSVGDTKDLHEVLPISKSELSSSVGVLYQKFDEEEKSGTPAVYKPELEVLIETVEPISSEVKVENDCEEEDFSVVEQGIELPSEEVMDSDVITEPVDAFAAGHVAEITTGLQEAADEGTELHSQVEEQVGRTDKLVLCDSGSKEDGLCTRESLMKELESALSNVSDMEAEELESPEDMKCFVDDKLYKRNMMGSSCSLDDVTESVANEFLNMLGIEQSPSSISFGSEPESPRERLLRQFEKEALATGCSLFDDFDTVPDEEPECSYSDATGSNWSHLSESFDLSSMIQAAEEEHLMAAQPARSKAKAKMLEDLETEALMREWGLNEMAFQHSPPKSSSGFGSPLDSPLKDPCELPSLGEGIGPFLQTKNGGFVRSMNPTLFKNAKSGGDLIMQVSSPVVVPAEMGSGVIDILQHLASVGIEKLSIQANKLMPLEDITGKTMEQVAWEALPALEGPQRDYSTQHETVVGQDIPDGRTRVKGSSSGPKSKKSKKNTVDNEMASEYVSLEDLAPLAMDKIEALSIEGLRIQSGMSDVDEPSSISTESVVQNPALQGKGVNVGKFLGLEGAAGLQLMDIKDGGNDVDGLMGLSLTLDEWMKLDSGEIDDEDHISERTTQILAAHHANSLDMIRGGSKGERRRGKGARKCGLLGNNFTVALMVQLRDPLRNYEPVGAPMLALIQVERVFLPPKPKIYSTVSELRKSNEEDDESGSVVKDDIKEEKKDEKLPEEESIPQFKIAEVHVAGLKTEPGKKKLWGNTNQQQSGSRWLVANGMGKNIKHPFLKSKGKAPLKSSTSATTKAQPGDTLWSISARVHGDGSKWKELAALNPHIRNPNVIIPNETIRLC
ncbi:protein PLASTID MOVEMENT IMPAIRED 1-RELATED 1 [Argentina anserina]|uniref:protein PLASTID MOVEMENT IMPAIRED 1-RELATED 1 n=1 Tax=Argentina anserina TaxID=57926 RepID=UPI0021763BD7|nr:protein PLASTID MOVEMENT IMPAIRED 1-RELATED 1 [Potentilla anserina]